MGWTQWFRRGDPLALGEQLAGLCVHRRAFQRRPANIDAKGFHRGI
jgi:hypothetical protein